MRGHSKVSKPYTLVINGCLDGFYISEQAAWNRIVFRHGSVKVRDKNGAFHARITYEPSDGTQQIIYDGNGED